ncbi:hypothetical protein BJ742DRAFT_789846 [Cladochytrium replicatum]|nr:hypothetical protein BJ742DRAFT_789846 [Cladochytrium replicatum]
MEEAVDLADALKLCDSIITDSEPSTPRPVSLMCEKSIAENNETAVISTSLHKSENISLDATLPTREFATLAVLDEQPLAQVASAAGAVEHSTAVSSESSFSIGYSEPLPAHDTPAFALSADKFVTLPMDHDDVRAASVILDVGIEPSSAVCWAKDQENYLSDKNSEIPRFYFPPGREVPGAGNVESDFLKRVRGLFLVESNSESSSRTSAATSSTTTSTNSPRSSNSSPLVRGRRSQGLQLQEQGLTELEFIAVTIACGLPRYINAALFQQSFEMGTLNESPLRDLSTPRRPWSLRSRMANTQTGITDEKLSVPVATFDGFSRAWRNLIAHFKDEEAMCFGALRYRNSHVLMPEDFESVLEDVVKHHPGLEFLSEMPVFQLRYVETVISRLFYIKARNWTDSMGLSEFRKTGFANILRKLGQDDDINATRHIFSYKHFYVIYCKFWEHDKDHDMLVDESAIEHYDGGALTKRCATRVMEVYRNMKSGGQDLRTTWPGGTSSCQLTYRDFITFILSVEDKKNPSSVEFWFRVLDKDGDGMLSFHELQWFWEEQFERMVDMRYSDPWKFSDFLCSLIDLVKPKNDNFITLRDLKGCKQCSLFFDMLFDLRHYELYIRRFDPQFREHDDVYILDREGQRVKLEGWEKFAERAYDELAIEESQQNCRTSSSYSMQYHSGDLDSLISLEFLAQNFDEEIEIDLSSSKAESNSGIREEIDEPPTFEAWAGGKLGDDLVADVEHDGTGMKSIVAVENTLREQKDVEGLALAADGFASDKGALSDTTVPVVIAVNTNSSLLIQHKLTSTHVDDDDIIDHTSTSCSVEWNNGLGEKNGKETGGENPFEEVEIIFEDELHNDTVEELIDQNVDKVEEIMGHVVTGEFVVVESPEGGPVPLVRKRPRPRTLSTSHRARTPSPRGENRIETMPNSHNQDKGWVSLVSSYPIRKQIVSSRTPGSSISNNYIIKSSGDPKKMISSSHRRGGVLRRANSGKAHHGSELETDLPGDMDAGVDVTNENAEL